MSKRKKENGPIQWQNKKLSKNRSPVKAKKYLGQHFLKDEGIAQEIANSLLMDGYKNVLEIGPGTGILTKYLLPRGINLIAIDLDSESIAFLKNDFHRTNPDLELANGTFQLIEADFLKYDLSTLFVDQQFGITGNFPYNISTQIVFRMLAQKERIPEFSGMFQKEVAQRICEKDGSKTYGILSVLVQAFYEAEYLFTVPPEVFDPPPKVESGVIRLLRKDDYSLGCDEKLFYAVVKTGFNQRRKTLRNSLKSFGLSELLKAETLFDLRPEQLSVSDFIALTKKIQEDVT